MARGRTVSFRGEELVLMREVPRLVVWQRELASGLACDVTMCAGPNRPPTYAVCVFLGAAPEVLLETCRRRKKVNSTLQSKQACGTINRVEII